MENLESAFFYGSLLEALDDRRCYVFVVDNRPLLVVDVPEIAKEEERPCANHLYKHMKMNTIR